MRYEENNYDLSVMDGCIKGKVPTLINISKAILEKTPVKYIVLSSRLPVYGTIESLNNDMRHISFRLDRQTVLENIRLDGIILFYAAPLRKDVFLEKGSSVLIAGEIYTVANSNEQGMSVWLDQDGLVYYGEDVQSLIEEYGGYTALII